MDYLLEEMEGDTLTPVAIFHRLQGKKKFLLESSNKHEKSGRYSFIGCDPYMEIKSMGPHTEIISNNQVETLHENIIETVKKQLNPNIYAPPLPFFSGAVGFIGYDVIRQYEEIGETPEDDLKMSDSHLLFYEKVVVMDHLLQKISIIISNFSQRKTEKEMKQEMERVKSELVTPAKEEFQREWVQTGKFHSHIEKGHFLDMVQQAKAHIEKGDIFQIVLSQRLEASFSGNPFSFYRELRKTSPSPYMFYIDFEDYLVLGASPESLIKVQGNEVMTNPIAGTRKRGATEEEDVKLEKELLHDEKELAEHRMLVDLARNDLGKVSEYGSIHLSKYMEVERFKSVMHLVSEVKGTLREDVDSLDVLSAILPAGTVSGAPKIRAMQIINNLESLKRGVYAGAVGYINQNGDLDFGLAIRTMVIKGNQAFVQAGAGIVLDSVPEKEWEETLNKAATLLEVKR